MKIILTTKKFEAKRGLFTVLTAMLMFALTVPATVGAIEATTATEQKTTAQTTSKTETATSTDPTIANSKDLKQSLGIVKAKLAADKLGICQKRETEITNIMARMGDRGQKQLDLFAGIATRAENFYTEKGKTLSNYDLLVTDVNNKKATAQLAVNAVKAATPSFKCDGDNPKATATSFKNIVKIQIDALNAYRQSAKNLIVGIKSVQSTTATTTTTNSTKTTTVGNQ
jgi:hypothetical protein